MTTTAIQSRSTSTREKRLGAFLIDAFQANLRKPADYREKKRIVEIV
jgi:hypothetical protein